MIGGWMNNFEFKNLILAGFRSFKDRQVIKLNRKPGLYFISGNNIRNPELGSNAVGKAQPLTSKILTPDGWKLMGEMQVGDKIIGVDGLSYNVLTIHPQGQQEVYKITFTDHSISECSEDHLWEISKINTSHKKNKRRVKRKE